MSWCSEEDVNERVSQWVGKGFSKTDVTSRIARAERTISGRFLAAYGAGTITGWTSSTPNMIKDLTADFAALFIKMDFLPNYKETPAEREATYKILDKLVKGESELLDADGNIIARATSRVGTNTGSKTAIFQMGSTGDDTYGQKSLDDYSPDQDDIEAGLES